MSALFNPTLIMQCILMFRNIPGNLIVWDKIFYFYKAMNTKNKILFSSCKFDDFQSGDIIFQISKSQQSKAIQMATHSQYSHVGVIFINRGRTYVYEAVQPVKLTPIDEWIKRGENEHFVVKRLKNANEILTKENQKKLQNEGLKFIGRKYDLYFGWSDKRIYCSELVWKIYKRALKIEVGKIDSLKNFDLENDIVKKKLKERYGKKIPLDMKVISPAAIFASEELETVYDSGD